MTFLGLLLTLPALAGCAVEPGDITDAARGLAASKRLSLDFIPGEYMVYAGAATELTHGLRLDSDGAVTLMEDGEKLEFHSVAVHKIMARVRLESAAQDGYVVAAVSRVTDATRTVDDEVTNLAGFIPERQEYHLYVADRWVRRTLTTSSGDDKSVMELAAYPLNPRPGLYYVDDRGNTSEAVESTERILDIPAVKLLQQSAPSPLAIENLFEECYEIVESEAGTPDRVDVVPRADRGCFGPDGYVDGVFPGLSDSYSLVGGGLLLKNRVYEESFRIDEIWCGAAEDPIVVFAAIGNKLYDCASDAEIYFTGMKTTRDETTVLVKRGLSDNSQTLPEIADATE